jgi:cell division protein FtsA
MSRKDNEYVIGLDIGTTKVCAVVGEATEKGIEVIGVGTNESRGMRKGMVIKVDKTVEAVEKAINEATLMAGCDISSVFTGIAGCHIRSINSKGTLPIKKEEVSAEDVDKAINAARAAKVIPENREIIHILPWEYIVDSQGGITDPIGMTGKLLEVRVHIVTAEISSAQNVVKCANRNGLNVNDIVLQPLASSEAVLHNDEKELGVALVDIGGGTTDLTVFVNGGVRHTQVIGLGGSQVTNDISAVLRTPMEEAEKVKIKHGCALTSMVQREDIIEVPSVGGRKPRMISRLELAEIVEPRMVEILGFVHEESQKSGCAKMLGSGIVLTGGASLLPGITELCEMIMGMPVRLGVPHGIGGLVDVVNKPDYSTAVGLMLHGYHKLLNDRQNNARGAWERVKQMTKTFVNSFF